MMLKGLFSDLSPIAKLLVMAFIIVVSFIITNAIGFLLSSYILGISFNDFINIVQNIDYNNHHHVNVLKYFQIIQTISLFLIPPVIMGYMFSGNVYSYLKINKTSGILSFLLAVFIMYSCMPLIEWMLDLNSHLSLPHQLGNIEKWMKDAESNAEVITKAFLNVSTVKGLTVNLIMIAVIPALGEELLFRGILVRFFKDWTKNTHAGIIISAVIFSLIHFQFYGFLPRMMLGILFGYLFVWSGTIWVPILVHFVNNGTAVVTYFLFNKGLIKTDVDKMFSFNEQYLYIIFSLIATAAFIRLFYFYTRRTREDEDLPMN